jgi:hypothetical protein
LLAPLGPGGTGAYRTALFDYLQNAPVDLPVLKAEPRAILLFKGVFLPQPDFRLHWDYKVFVEASFELTVRLHATPTSSGQPNRPPPQSDFWPPSTSAPHQTVAHLFCLVVEMFYCHVTAALLPQGVANVSEQYVRALASGVLRARGNSKPKRYLSRLD